MLIVLRLVKNSWATRRVGECRIRGYPFSFVLLPYEDVFYFILLNKTKGKEKMKRTLSVISVLLLICLIVTSCNTVSAQGLWENATYRRDTELGEGAKTVQVEVKAGDESVTFTIHTDKEMLGDALLEHDLVQGEQGAFGLYVKLVNGIEADYDKDGSYWGFYKNGEMMLVGVDGAQIADGDHYELVRE